MLLRISRFRMWTDDSGASAVEFAVILSVLLSLTFGIFELGRFFWTQNQLQFAVEETARKSLRTASPAISDCSTSVANRDAVTANIVALAITSTQPAVTLASATVADSDLTTLPLPKLCTITITYPFSFLGFLDFPDLTVQGVATYPCKESSGGGSGTACS